MLSVLATLLIFSNVRAEEISAFNRAVRDTTTYVGIAGANVYLAPRCAQLVNCANGVVDTAKCGSYGSYLASAAQMGNCKAYMLDDLAKMSSDKAALRTLRNIDKLASEPGRKFNLWKVALSSLGGDKRKAMQFLAAFFQDRDDTSNSLLSDDVNKLKDHAYKNLVAGMKKGDIQGYPPGIAPNKTGIYHFYAIGEIAAKMRDAGVPIKYASALPFAVNEGYEKALNRTKNVDDIYSGYAGISFALSSDHDEFTGVPFKDFQTKYLSDGAPAISRFFKHDLGGSEAFCTGETPYEGALHVDRKQLLEPPILPNSNGAR